MLRVGLTGGLGSGKTTVGRLFSDLGVHVIEADQIGRELMQPGLPVHQAIVKHFGTGILQADGQLSRAALARIVFGEPSSPSRLQELNRIVHPAVLSEQERRIDALVQTYPRGIAMVESALIFELERESDAASFPAAPFRWSRRFDKLILVTAPVPVRITRFVERALQASGVLPQGSRPNLARITALEQDARDRIAAQMPDTEKISRCDYVIENGGTLKELRTEVGRTFAELETLARQGG